MKRLLLDSHIFLWWLEDHQSLGKKVRENICNYRNQIYISAATTWEISIKQALGKLNAPEELDNIVDEERFIKLPISLYHGQIAGRLPPLHRDPFDRMLIAQAQAEGLILVTNDSTIKEYNIQTMDGNL